MPTNRRSGSNGQPSGRKPKVAGLRKREQTETTTSTDPTPDEGTTSSAGEGDAAEPAGAQSRESASDGQLNEAEDAEPQSESAAASERESDRESDSDAATAAGSGAEAGSASESAAESGSESESAPEEDESAPEEDESGPEENESGPEEDSAADDGTGSGGEEAGSGAKSGKSWVIWAVTAVFLIVAIVCGAMAYATYFRGPMANEAMVSAGETSEVKGQVEDGIQKLFSYDFNDTAKTEKAADDLLRGEAVKKYDELFSVVKKEAPKQQLVVNTTVKGSAVTRLQDDKATVLVFVDQHALRSGTGESNVGPAQLSVTTEKQGDSWKITNLNVR
ncbi:hypothetical protein GCM10009854_01440 [Saccharopolyspora halophila]|uniref:Mce-associated membrane protein n=1 Tax=Saccharopolyspora halophila TaxID=405551 RepID=A0ABN3FHC4_9PSEU